MAAINAGDWQPPGMKTFPLPAGGWQAKQLEDMDGLVIYPRWERSEIIETTTVIQLSDRQMLVLRALHQGYNTKQIARRFTVSQRTITTVLADLRRQFNASNSAQVVGRAIELGILSVTAPPISESNLPRRKRNPGIDRRISRYLHAENEFDEGY